MASASPVVILLAAGRAQRFGDDKRAVGVAPGQSLLTYSARHARDAIAQVVVVLRPGDGTLAGHLSDDGCRVCTNPRPDEGMGSSIACGVQASVEADGWLVLPADLPLLRRSSLRHVAGALRTADAVVPFCHGRRGHPVGFSQCFRDRLLNLSGADGARDVLRSGPERPIWLNLHDPGIYRDVDTPDDLQQTRALISALIR